MAATDAERRLVAELLGREPQGDFEIAVRDENGDPRVLRNAALLDDGTPMPTRYWLVAKRDNLLVGRLEGAGGVKRAEGEVPMAEIAAAHDRYAAERDSTFEADFVGPRPTGGVGGTRMGVKCLHAHYAYFLAGGDDPVGRWVDAHLIEVGGAAERPDGPVLAAIDCGTNSTRLLISQGGHTDIVRQATVTALGQGVDAKGSLHLDAIERVASCLTAYKQLLDDHDVEGLRITATSAARDADNRDDFFGRVKEILGVEPELLSGEEEGELSYSGAIVGLDVSDGPFLVVDLGGGSTEFCYGTDEFERAMSLNMGCVRMTEKYLHSDPPLAEELSGCITVVGAHLSDVAREMPQALGAKTLVGVAGTITNLAAIEIGLADYDPEVIHHQVLSKADIEDVFRTLAVENAEERLENPGLQPERVGTIVGGLCIVVKVLRDFGFDELLVSESDILDGLVMSQLD